MHEFDWWSNGSMKERGLGIRDPRNAGDRSGTDLAKLLWSQFGQVLGLNFCSSPGPVLKFSNLFGSGLVLGSGTDRFWSVDPYCG